MIRPKPLVIGSRQSSFTLGATSQESARMFRKEHPERVSESAPINLHRRSFGTGRPLLVQLKEGALDSQDCSGTSKSI